MDGRAMSDPREISVLSLYFLLALIKKNCAILVCHVFGLTIA